MQHEIRFQPVSRYAGGAFDQLFFFFLEHLISNTAFPIPLHQFSERSARFILQKRRRQFELCLLMQIFDDL